MRESLCNQGKSTAKACRHCTAVSAHACGRVRSCHVAVSVGYPSPFQSSPIDPRHRVGRSQAPIRFGPKRPARPRQLVFLITFDTSFRTSHCTGHPLVPTSVCACRFSMLNLHVRLHVIHNMRPLLIHHLSLGMRAMCHHRHLPWMTDLGSIVLVRTTRVRSVGSRSMLLLMRRLVVHRDAHVSLIVGRMRRRMRRRRTVPGHGHGLGGDESWVLQWVGHGSCVAL
jgi:hypothetical protein